MAEAAAAEQLMVLLFVSFIDDPSQRIITKREAKLNEITNVSE